MSHDEQTPLNPKALTGNRFYDDPQVLNWTRNEGHRNLLVDALVAKTILTNLPADSSDAEVDWAERNVQHARQVLLDYERRGYHFQDSPDDPSGP